MKGLRCRSRKRSSVGCANRWTFCRAAPYPGPFNEEGGVAVKTGRFVNEPDTDPALEDNRAWALEALANNPGEHGITEVTDTEAVNQAVAKAQELGAQWGAKPADERAAVLEAIGDELARSRGKLVSVAAYEANKTVTQTDPEISEAIDFCVYYAHSARQLMPFSVHPHQSPW